MLVSDMNELEQLGQQLSSAANIFRFVESCIESADKLKDKSVSHTTRYNIAVCYRKAQRLNDELKYLDQKVQHEINQQNGQQ